MIDYRSKEFNKVKETLIQQLDLIWVDPIHVEQRKGSIVVDREWKNNKLDCKTDKRYAEQIFFPFPPQKKHTIHA